MSGKLIFAAVVLICFLCLSGVGARPSQRRSPNAEVAGLNTNAKRFAAGLPPLAPVRRWTPVLGAQDPKPSKKPDDDDDDDQGKKVKNLLETAAAVLKRRSPNTDVASLSTNAKRLVAGLLPFPPTRRLSPALGARDPKPSKKPGNDDDDDGDNDNQGKNEGRGGQN